TDVDHVVFFVQLTDRDGDGIQDALDNCPDTANPGQEDTDSDSTGDACDLCTDDPAKVQPGACGCGIPDTDADGDGTPDCDDLCTDDPTKTQPGACGCGVPDTDTDGDGTPDCNETNQPPVADEQHLVVSGDVPRSITLTASDPDGDSLLYSIVSWPSGGVLSGTPPDLLYTPDAGYLGDDSFVFEVDDQNGETAQATIYLTVLPNQPPRITSMPLTAASVDYDYRYPVIASDPEGDPITHGLVAGPDGMTIDLDGLIQWTPNAEQRGDHRVAIQVSDGSGGSDTQSYWIRVSFGNSPSGNHSPVAHAGDDFTVEEGNPVELDASFSFDADGDRLQFQWTQIEGPLVALDSDSVARPAFGAPWVDGNTTLIFEVVASDGVATSEPALVHVTVLNMEIWPEGLVTNSNASGPGSLRAAVEYANANPGTRITFSIPDSDPAYNPALGVWSLTAPAMTNFYGIQLTGDGTFLDGTSQTENWGDRNPFGPEIEISGGYHTIGISANDVVLRGVVVNDSGGPASAIAITGGWNIVIAGNYIGTDPTGTVSRAPVSCTAGTINSRDGIRIWPNSDIGHVRIGGTNPGDGNLISGIATWGIWIDGHMNPQLWKEGDPEIQSVTIQGNLIGLDRTGTTGLVHCGGLSFSTGIRVEFHRADILIGGVTPGSRNIISGWSNNVELFMFSGRTRVQGNYLGTDITGSYGIPLTHANARGEGVIVNTGLANMPPQQVLIGGSEPGAGNLISGNRQRGVLLSDADLRLGDVEVKGNLIGTDATGTAPLSNGWDGVFLSSRVRGRIGGAAPGEGNVISGNERWGIHLADPWPSPYAYVQGNRIGLAADG
ncbi:MAG: cadherin-like domain-containing protein, partial [Deltaproteobacteria bacterium]|nr:cadherin-like domain-containing protein [Deltaproteobacteria bacterium]